MDVGVAGSGLAVEGLDLALQASTQAREKRRSTESENAKGRERLCVPTEVLNPRRQTLC